MAKRILVCSWLSLCLTAALAFAQYDVHYSIGLRYQYASWNTNQQYYKTLDDYNNGVLTDFDSEMSHLYGPTASINYQKFGASITYLFGSWEFPKYPYWIWDGFNYDEDEVTETLKRADLVITVSYRVIPRLSVFVGFKSLSLEDEVKYRDYSDFDFTVESNGSGAGGGISGSLPLNRTLHGYATIGYMSLGGDLDTENLILEGGFRMYFGKTPIYGSLGYRYESFDSGDTILSGPALTLAYYH